MADRDTLKTQRGVLTGVVAELGSEGFEDAEEIGRGGFGVVYRCTQPSLDRTVAIKLLTSDIDQEDRERFLREQHAMGRLSGHPHIVHILQVGITSYGRPYIAMPYHSSGSLDAQVRSRGPLNWREALSDGVKLAGALEAAHRTGTLHRDVKPANILLTDYGEPQLTDFGIARVAGGFETSASNIAGSPAFTAPEVLKGLAPTAQSDVYGLGATLFCLISGHAAFERRAGEQVVAQFLRITTQPIPDLGEYDIPDDLRMAIEHAMAGEPADRPASAAEFGHELRRAQSRNGLRVDIMAVPTSQFELASDQTPGSAEPSELSGYRAAPGQQSIWAQTPPSASTKFRPRTPSRPLVERVRLIDILRSGGRRLLTVIHAPAGFGKSTLAAQWRQALAETGVPVAWLSIDRDDNNVVWFLSHLVEAIRSACPTLAKELGQALEQHADDAERYVLTSLIDEIHQSGDTVAIVIDDWHRVTSDATIAAMDFLLDNGCHHFRVVVTSRSQAGLPMSRMRVRDELVEIDSSDLRFDIAESTSFLVDLNGLPLAEAEVADLRDSTDGWVAALQLASLSLRSRADPTELIRHMSGRHHAIGEYLVENVLNTLEPPILEFLLSTSVTERICGDLAEALAGVDRGQARLEEVENRDLFLRGIDEDRAWFRYHHLFAEFLQRRLERDHPARVAELHRTASLWFADRRMLSEAVDHALEAGDPQRAVSLVERDGMELIEHSKMATLLGMVAKLPPALVVSRPTLQLTVAWASVLLQRQGGMNAALELVRACLDQASLAEADVADLRLEADFVNAIGKVFADQLDGVVELVEGSLSHPENVRPFLASGAADVASFVAIYTFDFVAARRWQDETRTYHQRTTGPFSVIYGHCMSGIAANEQLDVAAAEESFRTALALARESSGPHGYAARLVGALLGALLYEKDNIIEAELLLDESYKLGAEGGIVDFMLATYGTGARVKVLHGELGSAARRLDAGATTAEVLGLPRLAAGIANERIKCGLSTALGIGDSPRSTKPRGQVGLPVNGILEITAELVEDSEIRLLLAAGSPECTEQACIRAEALAGKVADQGRPRAALRASLLLAECLSSAGRILDAKNVLAPVIATCAELGLVRFLIDGGPQVVTVITAMYEDMKNGRWQEDWPLAPSSFLSDVLISKRNG